MIEEEDLKNSIKDFLRNHEEFFEMPGAIMIHHNYRGGLLEHTVQTIEFALSIVEISTI